MLGNRNSFLKVPNSYSNSTVAARLSLEPGDDDVRSAMYDNIPVINIHRE